MNALSRSPDLNDQKVRGVIAALMRAIKCSRREPGKEKRAVVLIKPGYYWARMFAGDTPWDVVLIMDDGEGKQKVKALLREKLSPVSAIVVLGPRIDNQPEWSEMLLEPAD